MINLNDPSVWDVPLLALIVAIVVGSAYLFIGNKPYRVGRSGGDLVNDKFVQVPFNVDVFDAINAGWLTPNEDNGYLEVAITNNGRKALELDKKMLPSLRKFMHLLLE